MSEQQSGESFKNKVASFPINLGIFCLYNLPSIIMPDWTIFAFLIAMVHVAFQLLAAVSIRVGYGKNNDGLALNCVLIALVLLLLGFGACFVNIGRALIH